MAKHHPKRRKKEEDLTFYDAVIYFFAFTTPLFELPQAYLIYSTRSAGNVSVATWVYFCIASLVFLTYAVKHRIKPLIMAYGMYMIIELIIVIGIVRYS